MEGSRRRPWSGFSPNPMSALAEADQREVPERRYRAAFDQLHAVRTFGPFREYRPGEIGAPPEPARQRRHGLFDPAAQAGLGADPAQQHDLTARLEQAGEFVEGSLGVGDR